MHGRPDKKPLLSGPSLACLSFVRVQIPDRPGTDTSDDRSGSPQRDRNRDRKSLFAGAHTYNTAEERGWIERAARHESPMTPPDLDDATHTHAVRARGS